MKIKAERRKENLEKFGRVKILLREQGIISGRFPNTQQYRYIHIMYMGEKGMTFDYYPIGERIFNLTLQEWDDCTIEDFYFNLTGKILGK
jgi:hypothetical protein